jgi:hypothetical protein
MSAESIAPPIYLYKFEGVEYIFWGNCSATDKDYYLKMLNRSLEESVDKEAASLPLKLQLARFDAWKRNSGLDE